MRRLSLLFALFLLAHSALAQNPRESIPGIALDTSAPFAGEWRVGFPEGEGVIVSETLVPCEAPVVIKSTGAGATLRYASPEGSVTDFEILEFSGRTTWMPDAYNTMIAVWSAPDTFYLYPTNLGTADWNNPRVYTRCP